MTLCPLDGLSLDPTGSMDAENAFDQVDWSFMIQTLQHIGLGEKMHWVGQLHSTPLTSVWVNDCLSDPFAILNTS